ncbi:hypothetical protein F5877DRAFT_84437 [Lentinula edodes]|nr:hypothetical protein F5877DRAFT_84437 [Lentinula edodes]
MLSIFSRWPTADQLPPPLDSLEEFHQYKPAIAIAFGALVGAVVLLFVWKLLNYLFGWEGEAFKEGWEQLSSNVLLTNENFLVDFFQDIGPVASDRCLIDDGRDRELSRCENEILRRERELHRQLISFEQRRARFHRETAQYHAQQAAIHQFQARFGKDLETKGLALKTGAPAISEGSERESDVEA